LVSFFLIVYYQNQSSINSGLFTLLINRLGDCFFLVTLSLYFSLIGYSGFRFGSTFMVPLLPLFLVLTFMTKRAIFPFSPWLPLAMAAPTPISALVHSSTLVTSGLYLMIRYSYVIIRRVHLVKTLVVLCIFTSFYAGLNSIFETDLKKLIALSTLSHLGFMTHALFKSLLFMAIGDIMINLRHSQDIRYLSSGYLFTPSSCSTIYVSILNLLGLPAMRGFFSKDLVLETLNYTNASFALISILFINVVFTFYYRYQLFFYSFQPAKVGPYSLIHKLEAFHSVLLLAMAVSSLFFGSFFLSAICHSVLFFRVPLSLKLLPLFLSILIFLMLLVFGKQVRFRGRYV
jgi:NADH-ubiquinone oxidoreductase chain 5